MVQNATLHNAGLADAARDLVHHARQQFFVTVAARHVHGVEVEAHDRGVFLVESVELAEVGVEQRHACSGLVVVAQVFAGRAEHFGDTGVEDVQARPDQRVAESGAPPVRMRARLASLVAVFDLFAHTITPVIRNSSSTAAQAPPIAMAQAATLPGEGGRTQVLIG